MKVIIAGTRKFQDYNYLVECVKSLNLPITEVVCGECYGADQLGKQYALENNIPVKSYPAMWDAFGKQAGFIRNEQMACYGDILISFWDKKSKGTKMMIDLMKRKNKPVHVFLCLDK